MCHASTVETQRHMLMHILSKLEICKHVVDHQHSLACTYQLVSGGLRASRVAGDGRQHHPCNCNHQCHHCWLCCYGSYQTVDRRSGGLYGDTARGFALVLHTACTANADFSVTPALVCTTFNVLHCKHVHSVLLQLVSNLGFGVPSVPHFQMYSSARHQAASINRQTAIHV